MRECVSVCVFFLNGNLFCLHAKSCFLFLGASSVLSCFLPTLAVSFFILPLYLSRLLGNISSAPSLFYGVFLLLHLPVVLVLYPFHNLWCCYFPCLPTLTTLLKTFFIPVTLSFLFIFHQPWATSLFNLDGNILEIFGYFWLSSGDIISLIFMGDILSLCCG